MDFSLHRTNGGWRTVMQGFHGTPASSVDFGASRHFPINSLWAGGIRIMKLKFGPKTIDLRRVRRIVKVGDSLARVCFHTNDAILVRCCVRYPDGMTFTYPGTIEELQGLLRMVSAHERRIWKNKMLTLLIILCIFFCGCSDERSSQPLEVAFFAEAEELKQRGVVDPPPPHIAKLLWGDDKMYGRTLSILLEYERWKEQRKGEAFKPIIDLHFEQTLVRNGM